MKVQSIAPDNIYKEIWDFIIAIFAIFIAIELPLRLAFDYPLTTWYIEIVISLILFVDIIINFYTQTYVKGVLIVDKKLIAKKYVRKLFLFDVLAAIPFYLLALLIPAIHWIQWLSLTRLFKVTRLSFLIAKWRHRHATNPSILRLAVFFFWILLITHWIACLWILIARIELHDIIPTYTDAIYWAVTTVTTVGYGDITPVTELQKVLTMVAMFIGVAVYGYVIGNVASLLSNIDIAKAGFVKQMEDIDSFLIYKSVPKKLKEKVHDYYEYIWHHRMAQSEHELLSNLPCSLKTEISLHIHRQLIERIPFFKETDKSFICEMISHLQPQVFLPGDYVVKKGEVGNCMYFIGSGSLDVMSRDESSVIAKLKDGDYFGEIALIKQVARTRSVIARDYCHVYALEKQHFDRLMEKYPKFKKHIFDTIKKRQSPEEKPV